MDQFNQHHVRSPGEVEILIGIVAGESEALYDGISANNDRQLWPIPHEHKGYGCLDDRLVP